MTDRQEKKRGAGEGVMFDMVCTTPSLTLLAAFDWLGYDQLALAAGTYSGKPWDRAASVAR